MSLRENGNGRAKEMKVRFSPLDSCCEAKKTEGVKCEITVAAYYYYRSWWPKRVM